MIKRFGFSSELKRMSVVASVRSTRPPSSRPMVLAKGAPETIRRLLAEVPAGYDACYMKYARYRQ